MKAPNLRFQLQHRMRRISQKLFNRDSAGYRSHRTFTVPVLVINFYPERGGRIDRKATGDVDKPLEQVREHTEKCNRQIVEALERGSTYHGYCDPMAKPSLQYQILDTIEFLEPLPTYDKPGHKVPITDYNAILERVNIQGWVEDRGVKEVWLWGYHGGVIHIWESNMAGPYGDISNSDQDSADMPVLSRTYTLYHHNYGRGTSEAVENHMHQIEVSLRQINHQLFWRKFVGRQGEGRCGWAHFPPNGERDYDWANEKHIWTDIEDWRPDGRGHKKRLNCTRWNCNSLSWFVYWMQNLPGLENGLTHRQRPLTNWWSFVGDWDGVMEVGLGLFE